MVAILQTLLCPGPWDIAQLAADRTKGRQGPAEDRRRNLRGWAEERAAGIFLLQLQETGPCRVHRHCCVHVSPEPSMALA
jgi:hypothetical protein